MHPHTSFVQPLHLPIDLCIKSCKWSALCHLRRSVLQTAHTGFWGRKHSWRQLLQNLTRQKGHVNIKTFMLHANMQNWLTNKTIPLCNQINDSVSHYVYIFSWHNVHLKVSSTQLAYFPPPWIKILFNVFSQQNSYFIAFISVLL